MAGESSDDNVWEIKDNGENKAQEQWRVWGEGWGTCTSGIGFESVIVCGCDGGANARGQRGIAEGALCMEEV